MDRWVAFTLLQFVSAGLGFTFGFGTGYVPFIYVGGFFFAMGVFAATRWGFDRWRGKGKSRKRGKN